jgi:hypothetical protein
VDEPEPEVAPASWPSVEPAPEPSRSATFEPWPGTDADPPPPTYTPWPPAEPAADAAAAGAPWSTPGEGELASEPPAWPSPAPEERPVAPGEEWWAQQPRGEETASAATPEPEAGSGTGDGAATGEAPALGESDAGADRAPDREAAGATESTRAGWWVPRRRRPDTTREPPRWD